MNFTHSAHFQETVLCTGDIAKKTRRLWGPHSMTPAMSPRYYSMFKKPGQRRPTCLGCSARVTSWAWTAPGHLVLLIGKSLLRTPLPRGVLIIHTGHLPSLRELLKIRLKVNPHTRHSQRVSPLCTPHLPAHMQTLRRDPLIPWVWRLLRDFEPLLGPHAGALSSY